jgi:beta-xylosidase
VWAPSIRYHAGKFWIFFPTPDEGIYVTTATDPAGKWSEPHMVVEGKGLIDPCPLWDDDGKAYLVYAYAGSRAGIKDRLRVSPMAPDGSRLLSEGQIVYYEPGLHTTLEGPKFMKKDGWYYILAPAGGVRTGWQTVFRSRHVYGPYEDKFVLAQGSTPINGPHQGALVDTPDGEWWFVHFQDATPYGRITHLQPVEWRDGWPLMGINRNEHGVGEPVLRYRKPRTGSDSSVAIPQTSDEFASATLALQWQWHANHESTWHSLTVSPQKLRLFAQPVAANDLSRVPNLLLQKFPAREFTVETEMEFMPQRIGEQAGLVVMGREHATLALRRGATGNQLVFLVNNIEKSVTGFDLNSVRVRVTVRGNGLCRFSYAPPGGEFVAVGDEFQSQEGRWIGAKLGIYSVVPNGQHLAGHADFSYFRFSAPDGR